MHTTVYLCRHAEVYNPQHVYYGRLPGYGLSENGRRMAERLAGYLAGKSLDAIVSSPLLRAKQTSRIIASLSPRAPLSYTKSILELRSSWQGSPWSRIGGARFYEPPKEPGDETVPAIAARMTRALRAAASRWPGGSVVLVSHADPVQIALMALLGRPLTENEIRRDRSIVPDLASANRLVIDESARLIERTYVPQREMEAVAAL